MELLDLFYRLSRIHKIFLIVGCYAIVFILYYIFILSSFPFDTVERDIQNIRKDMNIEQEKVKKVEEIKSSIELQKNQNKELIESLPTKEDFDATSKHIDRIANEVGVKIIKFSPAKEEQSKEYSVAKIPFNLTLFGEYKKLGLFFHKLDLMPRLMHVESMTLQPRQGKATKRLKVMPLDANVVLATFRRMSEEELQAMSQQGAPTSPAKK